MTFIEPELTTILDYLRYATSKFTEAALFYGHGTETAWDEASALILSALNLPHDISPAVMAAHLTGAEKAKLSALIQTRIKKRIPVPYLTHEAWFCGLSFYVDERVLIPRSPLAELIQQQFSPWTDNLTINSILDLCTGSGCIAIACAKYFPDCIVHASDISKEALEIARINQGRHHLEQQLHLYQSDLFNALPPRKYDLIVSNPPYVSNVEMETLPQEYSHEPVLGLAADDQGLAIAMRIIRDAPRFLANEGLLFLEVGNSEVALAEKFPHFNFTWIEFTQGGGGVCVLTFSDLIELNAML